MNGLSVPAPPSRFSFTEETFTAFNVCMRKFLRAFPLPLTACLNITAHTCNIMKLIYMKALDYLKVTE